MQTAILGAGISGLTAARALGELPGEEYGIFDGASLPGGLCRVQEQDGFRFDVVSHVLHFRSERARRLVEEVLEDDLLPVERSAWIFFHGRYIPYPFQGHLGFLPWPEKLACLGGYLRAWARRQLNGNHLPDNFDEWIRYHFGHGIARHFMVPYNTELWGLSPGEMSTDWVRPFVPNSSLKETVRGLFVNRSAQAGYNSYFSYPAHGGMQALVDGLGSTVRNIQLGRRAVEIDLDHKTLRFEDGGIATYDRLISTIPLDVLIRQARGVPDALKSAASELRCSRLLNFTCCLRRPLPHSFHWIYFSEDQFPFFRLVFPSNISPSLAPAGCGIICAEISNPEPDSLPELEEAVKTELLALGMITGPADIAFTVRNYLTHAYPVHDLKRASAVQALLEFLKTKDVYSIGRFGEWRYSSIDDAIVGALDAVGQMVKAPVAVAG
jgi:protoporphyrinogen oxidase